MGNYTSACNNFMTPPRIKSKKAARVIFPAGEIRQFQESVKAAEIMLECPNFFLVNSTSLNINRRFSPLSADDELESNNIYIMFSMRRLNSMITPADMAVFWMAANSAAKRILGRISPEMEKSGDANAAAEQRRVVVEVPEFSYRLAVCRSRKPLLDTITEEPSCRRWGMSHLDFLDTKNENENGVSRIWKRIYKFKEHVVSHGGPSQAYSGPATRLKTKFFKKYNFCKRR